MDARSWDEMYREREQVFSGNPNGVLVAEITGMAPGRALDVGCGEGADAIWLARRGWQVTGVDVSATALGRGAAAAADVAERITWTEADVLRVPPASKAFDLVSVQYFPLPQQQEHTALLSLLDAVAPGGTLLVAAHDLADLADHPSFDPADYYQPEEIAKLLDAQWSVQVEEIRPRTAAAPEGTSHTRDAVLRARRG